MGDFQIQALQLLWRKVEREIIYFKLNIGEIIQLLYAFNYNSSKEREKFSPYLMVAMFTEE